MKYLALILCFLSVAHAATLNVPSQYGTLDGALNAAQPGDTILIAPGYYDGTHRTIRGGTADARIVIDGGDAEDVTLRTFQIRHPYITLRNVKVSNTTPGNANWCLYVNRGSHYAIIENCIFDTNYTDYTEGIQWVLSRTKPFGSDAASNCIIRNNIFQNIRRGNMLAMGGDYNLVENNTFRNGSGADFILLHGRYNRIRKNTFRGLVNDPAGGKHPDFIQTLGRNGNGSMHHIIEQNIVNGIGIGQVTQLSDALLPEIGDWIFRNNLFMNISNGASCSVKNVRYYNNVFYRVNYDSGGAALSFGTRPFNSSNSYNGTDGISYAHGAEVMNNVFLDCGQPGLDHVPYFFNVALENVRADNNLVLKYGLPAREDTEQRPVGSPDGWHVYRWYEENGWNGVDPQFVDIANEDARFLPTSPLRDHGFALLDVPDDFDGTARPLGDGWDIGMYESGGTSPIGSPPVVTITAPANAAAFEAGTSQTFTATATDAEDGNIAAAVVWASNLAGPLGTGGSINRSLGQGTHTITATVTDSDGRIGGASISVTATAPESNAPPTVAITAPSTGISAQYNDLLDFAATATDAIDGDISGSIVWTSSLEGELAQGAGFTRDGFAVGTHTITATVTDSGGLSDSASITLNISQGDIIFGDLVELEWDANDGDENVTDYRIYLRRGSDPYTYSLMGTTSDTEADVRVASGVHYFVVTAVNAAGESPFSSALEVTTISGRLRFRAPGRPKLLIP
jgi:hypothetical protein